MKKYNLSEIMKNAWELVKSYGIAIATAMRTAWAAAKKMKTTEVDNFQALDKMAAELFELYSGYINRPKYLREEFEIALNHMKTVGVEYSKDCDIKNLFDRATRAGLREFRKNSIAKLERYIETVSDDDEQHKYRIALMALSTAHTDYWIRTMKFEPSKILSDMYTGMPPVIRQKMEAKLSNV